MSKSRKTLVVTLVATFEGDYIPPDQLMDYMTMWIDAGLEDRDDLVGWELRPILHVVGPLDDEDAEDEAA
jgi:hypothetical protein